MLPEQFKEMIASYGAPALEGLCEALETTPPSVAVRVNSAKGATPPAGCDAVPWWEGGFYLDSRPRFTFDPAMHQGLYYVQDASSMALAAAVAHLTAGSGPVRYLDACAAPGGKTTAAIDALPRGSMVVANEWDSHRAAVLAENVSKWGYGATVVSRGDTAAFGSLPGFFDIVAADVPCSGEGMMRKEADAVAQWSPALVSECAELQRRIVANLWPSLRPGGYLIYSTCTFNRSENELNVEWIARTLGATSVELPLSGHGIAPGIDTDMHCYRFIPGRVRGEGLFMAVLRKDGHAPAADPGRRNRIRRDNPTEAMRAASRWLEGDFIIAPGADGTTVNALPAAQAPAMMAAASALRCLTTGIGVATVKGRDLIPSQSLALATALAPGAFPTAEVDLATALSYLRREPVTPPGDAPRGHLLLTYGGRPLGFVKHLGNRANNLYPQPWRILSPHNPDRPVKVLT